MESASGAPEGKGALEVLPVRKPLSSDIGTYYREAGMNCDICEVLGEECDTGARVCTLHAGSTCKPLSGA